MITKIVEKLTRTRLWPLVRNHAGLYRIYRNTFGRLVNSSRNKLKHKMSKMISKSGMRIIEEIENILDLENVCYFVCAGTLLGLVRDGKLIEWDDDIDFGIIINEKFTWQQLEACMKKIGFSLKLQYDFHGQIAEQTYVRDIVLVDFYNHVVKEDCMKTFGFYHKEEYAYKSFNQVHTALYTIKKISGSRKIIMPNGIDVRIPNEVEEYLRDIYGETWQTPNPDYVANSGPSCLKLGDDELGLIEQKI